VSGDPLVASGTLARSLDRDLAGAQGPTRILVSFRDKQGGYCRLFQAPAIEGIACHEDRGWVMQHTQANAPGARGEFRQAGSGEPGLFAAAQGMMAGDPLDAAAERAASAGGWRK
jgi:hypothetical protein